MAVPFAPYRAQMVELVTGTIAEFWRVWVEQLTAFLQSLETTLAAVPGVHVFTLAGQPALGLADAGYVAFVSDYGHFVRWTGAVWQFAPGDCGNGFWSLRPIAPQEVGWQLMDGTVTDYLTVGGVALAVTPYVAVNVPAGTFLKNLAAYTGAVDAAIAPVLSGVTGTAGDSGATGDDLDIFGFGAAAGGTNVILGTSKFTHAHTVGSLAANTAARPPALGGLLYFRR